jgi:hypothetical protein
LLEINYLHNLKINARKSLVSNIRMWQTM